MCAALLAVAGNLDVLPAQENLSDSGHYSVRRPGDGRLSRRNFERATHRGYEVARGPVVVIAATNLQDARAAAEQATNAWTRMAELHNRFDQVDRRPPFPLGSLQVFVDQASLPRERLGLLPEGSAVGQMTQMAIALEPGGPSRDVEQQLRAGAARAYLHAAALDRQLPNWVCDGLAAYVAAPPLSEEPGGEPAEFAPLQPPLRASQQRLAHASTISPVEGVAEQSEAASLVRFLLEGDDARHAGPFLTLLAKQLAESDGPASGPTSLKAAPTPPVEHSALTQFVNALADDFTQWKKDPQMGQPTRAVGESTDHGLDRETSEFLFALKLLDRFAERSPAAMRTRITTFDRGKREAIVLTSTAGVKPPSIPAFLEALDADGQLWASIGPDGKPLWSTDGNQLRELLGVDDNRYQHVWHDGRWVLERKLADGRRLLGWLESNPANPRRPLAKMEIRSDK